MGGTVNKFLIEPDLITKDELDELLTFAFNKPDMQAKLKAMLRSHGWVEDPESEPEEESESTQAYVERMFGGNATGANGGR